MFVDSISDFIGTTGQYRPPPPKYHLFHLYSKNGILMGVKIGFDRKERNKVEYPKATGQAQIVGAANDNVPFKVALAA